MENNSMEKKWFLKNFESIQDIRQKGKIKHKLIDIIIIVICACMCNIDEWEAIELFANANYEWFKKLLELPNGIPSHDTIERVFRWINPKEFKTCFINWVETIRKEIKGEVISIDGKTVRGSEDGNREAIHMVNVWANSNRLIIGQMKVYEKSNEITAIPELIKILELSECVITIDAMGCQKEIAKAIVKKNSDYVLALKGNHKNMHEDVSDFLDEMITNNFKDGVEKIPYDYYEKVEKGHGRIEKRKYWITNKIEWLENYKDWAKITTVGVVEATREIKGRKTVERRYYISSLPMDAIKFAHAVRSHWGIENKVHWLLDAVFGEDKSKIRKDNAPENMAIARQLGINLLRKAPLEKLSLKAKALSALMDSNYRERALLGDRS
jgi:predicted transposase YbfD/YdcC